MSIPQTLNNSSESLGIVGMVNIKLYTIVITLIEIRVALNTLEKLNRP